MIKPALWLIVFIVGLPQLSETVYTPALPDIAKALATSDAFVEYTLTIYLFGFAVGTLFWGKISDAYGRKAFVLAGFVLYLCGCAGCYMSNSITALMVSRFIQAFGGSVGSVLGQAICRDAFHGAEMGKAYSTVGGALAFSPAIGPIVGGFIDQNFGWSAIFLFLIVVGAIVTALSFLYLPETHHKDHRQQVDMCHIIGRMLKDRDIWGYGILVAGCNGIGFSYFAEGPFYLIDLLGLTPSMYGRTFLLIAAAAALGGYASRRMHNSYSSFAILRYGLWITMLGTAVFSALIFGFAASRAISIFITLACMFVISVGVGMVISNSLSLALRHYRNTAGTAGSLFGFFYYVLISLCTLGMGALHNNTLYPMPIYFAFLSAVMIVAAKILLKEEAKSH